jgi:hypothetical protein
MVRVVLHLRPTETVAGLELGVVEERATQLTAWRAEVQDTRLSDAPFLTVVVTGVEINDHAAAELRDAFRDLPTMTAYVVHAIGDERPLEQTDTDLLQTAAHAFPV